MESQSEMLNYRELWKEGNIKKGWAEERIKQDTERDCVEGRRQIFERKKKVRKI